MPDVPAPPLGIVRAVINAEEHPVRFERFCIELVSRLEGGRVVASTSANYDRGRDGRTVDRGPEICLCASTEEDPDDKAERDIVKVSQHGTPPAKVYFCSSQNITEDRRNKIAERLRSLLRPGIDVNTLGGIQLADASMRFPDPAMQCYGGEISYLVSRLQGNDDSEPRIEQALQLALCASGHPDSDKIRMAVYESALLSTLDDGQNRTAADLSRDVSAQLHLSKSIPDNSIALNAQRLVANGLAALENDRYRITDAGKVAALSLQEGAAAQLLAGRRALREQLENALGYRLDDAHFTQLWAGFQDRTVTFFYERGQALVAAVQSFLGQSVGGITDIPSLLEFVKTIADGAAATTSDASQAKELHTAISDIFKDRTGAAFDWLVATAASFLALCSLGLEESSGKQLRATISRVALVPDTDVVLSFLGEGEPEHDSVSALLRHWKAIGGELLLATPVLAEAAHHAWIAPNDFREVESWIPGTAEERQRLIINVFTRAFAELMAKGKLRNKGLWPKFLSQFRGTKNDDSGPIRKHSSQLLPFGVLPQSTHKMRNLRDRVKKHMLRRPGTAGTARSSHIGEDKARRDAELYASIVEHATRLRQSDSAATCLLVTSSGRLRSLEGRFDPENDRELVLSVPMLMELLSLVPGVALGIRSMKALLFERRLGSEKEDRERLLLRVLKESEEFSMPWAKRGLLEAEVRRRIVSYARMQEGQRADRKAAEARLTAELMGGKPSPAISSILAEALDAVSAETTRERELTEAKRMIRELQEQLEFERARRR